MARLAGAARDSGRTVAVAESLTCGAVVNALGLGENAADWLLGGVVAYRSEIKVSVLGMTEGTDPCSAACAEQLARGVRELFGSDVAVATTGVGGPDPDGGHPPGTVYLGWSTSAGEDHRGVRFDGGPEEVLARTVHEAVRILVRLVGAEGR